MGTKVVHVSDLTGRQAEAGEELGRLVVLEHPDIAEPATLEVFPKELGDLQSTERLVRLEFYPPGARRPQPLTVTVDQFNALAKGGEMRSILVGAITASHEPRARTAPAAGRRRHPRRGGAGKVDYRSLEHAGEPHRGRITEAEKDLVRNNLEAINRRLRQSGQREINADDPVMRQRYGL